MLLRAFLSCIVSLLVPFAQRDRLGLRHISHEHGVGVSLRCRARFSMRSILGDDPCSHLLFSVLTRVRARSSAT
jgi:hypothetical protein